MVIRGLDLLRSHWPLIKRHLYAGYGHAFLSYFLDAVNVWRKVLRARQTQADVHRSLRPHPFGDLLNPALVAVERPHALVAARLEHARDLAETSGPNGSPGAGTRQQDFAARHAQSMGGQEFEALTAESDETISELRADACPTSEENDMHSRLNASAQFAECIVARTRCPVSAAFSVNLMTSGVRISLTTRTSGFSRSASIMPCSKLGECVGISRCRMNERRLV